ncbi:ricin-type beta-trefoil lectin domain protein [Lentzea tibetensis]|uniref:Ricin-type beta-trefoil lectin domain protein n=1 Tax=Lentzea tibetensis TaxID=2591470 RepID=A0A563EJC7_9PSEU|nr:RICIN domain-containing protein [Lentzea tibetensis]TWP46969.1 ricin-type beta-trefoil lectin domain protein [Lentzea tibetensis]
MRVILAVLAVVLSSLFVTTTAQAEPIGTLTAHSPFYSRHDWRCLDSDVSSPTHNGTKVQIWDCNGWNNQKWTYYSDHTIRSTHDGRCLDSDVSSPTHNGTKVQMWDCNGWANQKWTVYTNGQVISHHDGRCLDLDVASPTRNGSKIQVWDCNGWANQSWYHP